MDAADHQRHDAGREAADDQARHDQRGGRCRHGRQCDCNRFDQERHAQRRGEAGTVGEMSRQQRPDHGADAVQHPVIRPRCDPLPEPAGDEIDQEYHVRHQRQRIEAVLQAQCEHQRRAHAMRGDRLLRRTVRDGRFRRPRLPADQGQHRREHAEATPGLLDALLQQQRHQRARGSDAEADTGEDHAADQAALARRGVRQNRSRGQHHDDAAADPGEEAEAEEPDEGDRHRAGKAGDGSQHHHAAQRPYRADARAEVARDQRAGQITGEVCGAEIDCFCRREPLGRDQCRDQRRVGKARQPEPDQRGAQARRRGHPQRFAGIVMRPGMMTPVMFDIG